MNNAAARTGTPPEAGDESATDQRRDGQASGSDRTADQQESAADQAERDHGAVAASTEQQEETPATDRDEAPAGGIEPEASATRTADRSEEYQTLSTHRPSFVRPPGMPPPPDRTDDEAGADRTGWTEPGPRASATGIPERPPLRSDPASARHPSAAGTAGAGTAAAGTTGAGIASPYAPAFHPGGPTGTRTAPGEQALAVGTARVREAVRSARSASVPRGPRRARLAVRRLDPWSVMKFAFMVSMVLFVVMIVAASVLYLALDTMGVFASINSTLSDLIASSGGEGEGGFRISAQGVIGTAAAVGALNVLLFTALATLGAFIYNVCADLVGGIEVTLAERD